MVPRVLTVIERGILWSMRKQWWDKFEIQGSGCWKWLGSCTSAGYGQVMVGGKIYYTHRLFYERFKGPIPEGLHIDHLCRNRWCCNPSHLEPVTCRENLLRGETSVARNTAKTHCAKGHEFTKENTYTSKGPYGPKRKCRECNRLRQLEYTERKFAEAGLVIQRRKKRGRYNAT